MSVAHDDPEPLAAIGTRFAVYPQPPYVPGYEKPELIWISVPPDRIEPGPADDRMYVVDPRFDKEPYQYPLLPPFVGATFPPATAGPDGNFDHIPPDSREFLSAHAYACVRRVLDIWQSYLGETIPWHFASTYERLEIVPFLEWDNAQSGYGFVELGVERDPTGLVSLFALNFDVIAHELGHSILMSLAGIPSDYRQADFRSFHESMADLVSLISMMHFDTALDRVLQRTRGNLHVLNELGRIAELADERQIRIASNDKKFHEVSDQIHDRSRPLTGAIFDTMVGIFHGLLERRGLVDGGLNDLLSTMRGGDQAIWDAQTERISAAYRNQHFAFKAALADARDIVGTALVHSWTKIEVEPLWFVDFANVFIRELKAGSAPWAGQIALESLQWRGLE